MLGLPIVSGSQIGSFSCPNDFSGWACGNHRAIPPWMGFTKDPNKYVKADQVLQGFKLLDPSKMKDPQINKILMFWYLKQEGNGFGFKCLQDDRSIRKKQARVDSDSDSNSDSDVNSEPRRSCYPRTSISRSRSRSKSKGKGKMVERSEDRWTDYIVPDSRRKKWKVITRSEDEDDGEVFDFASVNQMESSDKEDI